MVKKIYNMYCIYGIQNTHSSMSRQFMELSFTQLTYDTSSVIHMFLAISGGRTKAAEVNRILALRLRGTGHPTRPKREVTGSKDWFSYMYITI